MGRVEIGNIGRGIATTSAAAGLLAGAVAAVSAAIGPTSPAPQVLSALGMCLAGFALAYCFLIERGDRLRPILPALAIGAIVALPAHRLANLIADPTGHTAAAAVVIWFTLAAPVAICLLSALTKAYLLRQGADAAEKPRGKPAKAATTDAATGKANNGDAATGNADAAFFLHVLTLPLVMLIAAALIGPAAALIFAGGIALGPATGAMSAHAAPYTLAVWPIAGAATGWLIGVVRGRSAVLGALRFVVVAAARLAIPALAVAAATLVTLATISGPWVTMRVPHPSAGYLVLAAILWLTFCGVRQSGAGGPPGPLLRLPALFALLIAPVIAWFAFTGFGIRIDAYGLTPMRALGIGAAGIALVHAVAGALSVIGEMRTRADRWMPWTSGLNAVLAALSAVALLSVGAPGVDIYAASARNQANRLLAGKVDAEAFDYAFLRFSLGDAGDDALGRVAAAIDHPQAATIRSNVELVRRFDARASYLLHRADDGASMFDGTLPEDNLPQERLPTDQQARDPATQPDAPASLPASLDELPMSPAARGQSDND